MKIGVVRKSVGPCGPCGFESHPRYRRFLPREQARGPAIAPDEFRRASNVDPRDVQVCASHRRARGGHGGETRWDRICLPQPIPQKDGDNPRPARSENACCAPSRFFVFGLDCTGLRLDHAFKNWVNPVEVGLQVGAGRFGCHFHGDAAEVQVDVRVQAEQEMVKHEGTPSRRGLERAGPCSGQVDS